MNCECFLKVAALTPDYKVLLTEVLHGFRFFRGELLGSSQVKPVQIRVDPVSEKSQNVIILSSTQCAPVAAMAAHFGE